MVTIYIFDFFCCSTPLIMTYLFPKDPISRIDSINLLNAIGLAHCYIWAVFSSFWKQKYSLSYGGGFWRVIQGAVRKTVPFFSDFAENSRTRKPNKVQTKRLNIISVKYFRANQQVVSTSSFIIYYISILLTNYL